MHDTELKRLASEYADGALDFYSYRKKRALFINDLIKEKDSDDTLQPIKDRNNKCKTRIKFKTPENSGIENNFYQNKTTLSLLCAAALIAIVMSVFYLLNDGNNSKESHILVDENKEVIDNSLFFAAKKLQGNSSWSTDNTNTFYNAWNQASSDEKITFSESVHYQQLAYSIEQELMLLKSVGESSGSVDDNLATIKKIAVFFGIDVDQDINQSEIESDSSHSIESVKKQTLKQPSTALKKIHVPEDDFLIIEKHTPTTKTYKKKIRL